MVLGDLRVGQILCVNLKLASRELEGPQRLLPSVKGEHLEQMGAGYGWIIGDRVHWKLSARKATHPSTISALGCQTSE